MFPIHMNTRELNMPAKPKTLNPFGTIDQPVPSGGTQHAPAMSSARIEGQVLRVLSKARHTMCFEGSNLRKVGAGSKVRIDVGPQRFDGDLIAISPTRVIVHVAEMSFPAPIAAAV